MERTITFVSWGRQITGTVEVDPKRKRIQLYEEEMPGVLLPYATCTAAIDGLADDEYAIKDWAENEGMVELLVGAGVIAPPHRYVMSGWVTVPVCRLKEG